MVEVAAAVAGEVVVAVAVVAAAAEVVVVSTTYHLNLTCLTRISGWSGGNSDPIRNSRW